MATKRQATDRLRALTRAGIKRPTDTGETMGAIAAKLAANAGMKQKHAAAGGAVVQLKRENICVAAQVFQWRTPQYNMIPSDDHIFEMAKATQNTGALEPILVLPVADSYYVMDGHHRLAAYITAGWKGNIPAIVFNGSLDEAVREALKRNTKNKLPMTAKDKTEAAWRLVKLGKPGAWPDSISEVAAMCGIGQTTVDRMRAAWTELHNGQFEGIEDLSWKQARDTLAGKDRQAFDEDSYIEGRAESLASAIARAELHLSRDIEVTARALEMLDPGLPEALMAYWAPPRPFDPTKIPEEELGEDGQPHPF